MPSYFLPRRYAPSKAPLVGFISAGLALDPSPFQRRVTFPIPLGFRRFGMFALQVDGDSMSLPDGGGLPHGCYALVDRRDVLTQYGHVFAFRMPDGSMVVKRLRLRAGRPAMYSDNPAHGPTLLDSSMRNMGRVYATSLDGLHWEHTKYRGWDH